MDAEQPLLQPYWMGELELANRIMMAPFTRSRATGAELRPRAKFCDECGSPIAVSGTSVAYKQVTVLFADVVH
jgi:2,4-dienoyl-CoA reductase-like NADH-dependent reductase (Old Yellow Enzyme family)